MVPFVTHMTVSTDKHGKKLLQPYIAANVNHNNLNESKVMNIIHTIYGNSFHDVDYTNIQPEEMGSNACVIIGVSLGIYFFSMIFHLIANQSIFRNFAILEMILTLQFA